MKSLCRAEFHTRIAKTFRSPRRTLLTLFALGGLFLSAAACRRSTSPASGDESASPSIASTTAEPAARPAGKIDGCALVTREDAERILGEPVQEPKDRGSTGCTYEIVDFGVGGRTAVLMVSLDADGKDAYEGYKRMSGITDGLMDRARDDAAASAEERDARKPLDSKTQQLSGIGDKGYLNGAFHGGFMNRVTLSALKGDTWLLMEVIGTPKKGSEEALREVAKKVTDAL